MFVRTTVQRKQIKFAKMNILSIGTQLCRKTAACIATTRSTSRTPSSTPSSWRTSVRVKRPMFAGKYQVCYFDWKVKLIIELIKVWRRQRLRRSSDMDFAAMTTWDFRLWTPLRSSLQPALRENASNPVKTMHYIKLCELHIWRKILFFLDFTT